MNTPVTMPHAASCRAKDCACSKTSWRTTMAQGRQSPTGSALACTALRSSAKSNRVPQPRRSTRTPMTRYSATILISSIMSSSKLDRSSAPRSSTSVNTPALTAAKRKLPDVWISCIVSNPLRSSLRLNNNCRNCQGLRLDTRLT